MVGTAAATAGCKLDFVVGTTATTFSKLDFQVGTAAGPGRKRALKLDLLVGTAADPGDERTCRLDLELGSRATEPLGSAAGISRGLRGHLGQWCR